MTTDPSVRFGRLAVCSSIRVPRDLRGDDALRLLAGDVELAGKAWWHPLDGEWEALTAPVPVEAVVGSRWVIDADRARALLDHGEDGDGSGAKPSSLFRCVSFEVNQHQLDDRTVLSIVVGAWTHWPQSRDLAPEVESHDPPPGAWSAADAASVLDNEFLPGMVRPLLDALSGRLGGRIVRDLQGKWANPPDSYVLVPAAIDSDRAIGWFEPECAAALREVLERFLDLRDLRDARLAASVQSRSGVVTLSRVFAGKSSLRPNLVFLPARLDDIGGFEAEAHRLARYLEALDDRETYALWDIATDLEMHRDRVGDFRMVARGAAEVINPLLLELADAESAQADRVQEAIDLVRTTLLQSGPEIMQIRNAIAEQQTQIENHQQAVREARISVGEQTPAGLKHVDEALHAEYRQRIQLLLRQALDALANVEQARPLIEGTAAALAERREQSLARLVTTAHRFNIVLVVLAVATTLDLLVHFNWDKTYGWVQPAFRFAVLATLVAVVAAWAWSRLRDRSPRQTARDQEVAHIRRRLVRFLQATSLSVDNPPDGSDTWESYDAAQAEELANLYDAIDELERRVVRSLYDPGRSPPERMREFLVGRASHWSLRALLMGERPFPLPSRLPLVACVYHFREGGVFVSKFEFLSAVRGYIPEAAMEEFQAWGRQEGPDSASAIDLLGRVRAAHDLAEQPEAEAVPGGSTATAGGP